MIAPRFHRHFALLCALGAASALVSACADSTGPTAMVDIAVEADSVVGPFVSEEMDGTFVACEVWMKAVGTGSTGTGATWLDATTYWYEGADRAMPADSTPIPASTVGASWGKATLLTGESRRARWRFRSHFPFEIGFAYRYRPAPGAETRTAIARFACGPVPGPQTPPPSITALEVTQPVGEVQPGDVLEVRYAARSDVGVERTSLALSGPCADSASFWENLGTSATRTVRIPLTTDCQLGVPIRLVATVVDGAQRTASRELQTTVALVDRRPPSVHIPFYHHTANGGEYETYAGDFFAGDTMPVTVYADDNHALGAILWEIRPVGLRDSLLVSGPSAATTLRIGVRPEWTGAIQLRVWVRDWQGLESDTIVSLADSLRVYPSIVRASRTAWVGGGLSQAFVDTLRGQVLLLQQGSAQVVAVSLATAQVIATVPVTDYATEFDATAGGDSLVVLLPNRRALAIVDLRDLAAAPHILRLTAIDSALGQAPWHLRVASNGKVLIATRGPNAGDFRLMELDLGTGVQRFRDDAGNGGYVGEGLLFTSLDHTVVVLAGGAGLGQRYDPSYDRFGPLVTVPTDGGVLSSDRTGRLMASGLKVLDATFQVLRTMYTPSPGGYRPTAISPDGQVVYHLLGYLGLLRSRVSDGALLDRALLPYPLGSLWPSANGATLVSINDGGGTVTIIDLR